MPANNHALWLQSTAKQYAQLHSTVDIRNLDRFSFEAWIKVGPNSTQPNQSAFTIAQGGSHKRLRFACTPIKGKLRFEFARADGTADTNYTYNVNWDDRWHHVAFTADIGEAEYQIFLDGSVVQSGHLVGGGKDNENNALKVSDTQAQYTYIGAWPFAWGGGAWDGKIDGIRLWKTVLSANAIQTNMFDHINVESANGILGEFRLENEGGTTITGVKHSTTTGTWTGTLANGAGWTTDRPFLGDGEQDVDPPTKPTVNAPTNITSTSFDISWTESTDNVYVQGYDVTVSTLSDFSSPVGRYSAYHVGRNRTLKVTDLDPGTNYYFQVRAFDANGNASDYATRSGNPAITTVATGDLLPPSTPTMYAASVITPNSFALSWSAATDNVGVAGYKLDVAKDPSFTNFVPSYRNLDVGNVTSFNVINQIDDDTKYYARVRAYDTSDNESADSNVIEVVTEKLPDLVPPAPVLVQPATSIASEEFVARWNETSDNVGVAGYLVDVTMDENHSQYLPGYQARDVGLVLAHRVYPTEPESTYYVRVRAYDAAGNISEYSDHVEQVITLPRSAIVGGMYEVGVYPTIQKAVVPGDDYVPQGRIASQTHKAYDALRERTGFYPLNDYAGSSFAHNHSLRIYGDDGIMAAGQVTGEIVTDTDGPFVGSADTGSIRLRTAQTQGTITFDPNQLRLDGANGFTLATFFKWNGTASEYGSLFTARSRYINAVSDHLYFDLSVMNSKVYVGGQIITNGNIMDYQSQGETLTANAWHFLAVTYTADTDTLRIYLNGTLRETVTLAEPFPMHRSLVNLTMSLGSDEVQTFGGKIGGFVYENAVMNQTWVTDIQTKRNDSDPLTTNDRYILLADVESAGEGTKSAVALSVFAYDKGGAIRIHRITNTHWDEDIEADDITYSTEYVEMIPSGGQQDVDVTSLVTGDPWLGLIIMPKPGTTNPVNLAIPQNGMGVGPYLNIEVDPTTAIEMQDVSIKAENVEITNYLSNGGFEASIITLVSTTGSGVNRFLDTDSPFEGDQSLRVELDGVSGARGVVLYSPTALDVDGPRDLVGSFWVRAPTDYYHINNVYITVEYTDATSQSYSVVGGIYAHRNWTRVVANRITTDPEKTISRVRWTIRQTTTDERVFWLDNAAIIDVTGLQDADVPYFDGYSANAEWQGAPHTSIAVRRVPRVTSEVTYIGDNNDNSAATFKSRLTDSDSWLNSDGQTTVDRDLNTFTHVFDTFSVGVNEVVNPSFEGVSTEGWEATGPITPDDEVGFDITDEQVWVGARSLKVTTTDMRGLGVKTHKMRAIKSAPYLARMAVLAPDGKPMKMALTGYTNLGASTGTKTALFVGTGEWQEIELDEALETTSTTDHLVLSIVTDHPIAEENAFTFYIDAVQVQRASEWRTDYLDGHLPGAVWMGEPDRSPTAAMFDFDTTYDVRATITDPDGIYGGDTLGESFTIPLPPDNALHTKGFEWDVTHDSISLTVPYDGDDNETSSVDVSFKRHDLATWSRASSFYDRKAKVVRSTIPNLRARTAYDVKVEFFDSINAVYGENPMTRVVTTGVTGVGDLTDPSITFGGFVLNGPNANHIAVLEHDGFSHPTRNVAIEQLARQDGEVEQQSYWGRKTITMTGVLSGTTRQELADNLREFQKALARPKQPLVVDTLDSRGFYTTATVTGLVTSERGGENIRHLVWNAEFTCADPFRYDISETRELDIILFNENSVVVTNTGDVPCDAIYTIKTANTIGSQLRITLANTTTGVRLLPEVTITRGDILEIDTQRLRVTKNGVEVDFQGGFPRLAVGPNRMQVLIYPKETSAGSPYSINLSTRRRHRYF